MHIHKDILNDEFSIHTEHFHTFYFISIYLVLITSIIHQGINEYNFICDTTE